MPKSLASSLVLSATAYLFKPFLKFGCKNVQVNGLPILLEALKEGNLHVGDKGKGRAEPRRRGIVTGLVHHANVHVSSVCLTNAYVSKLSLDSRRDIMFTNHTFSKFFELGQVINTERGGGVFQPAIDQAIQLLQDGEWIHIFPEGKVNQPSINPDGGLLRFKWGIGRIIMDSEVMPEIIPMWISGFDRIMPEPRGAPRFLPRPGASISVNFGEPLTHRIQPLVDRWRDVASGESGTLGIGGRWEKEGDSPSGAFQKSIRSQGRLAGGQEEAVRIEIVQALQEGVRELGEAVERREGRYERGEWCQSRK